MDNIIIVNSAIEIAEKIALIIQKKAKQKAENNEQLYLAISGGNTPKILFIILAQKYKSIIPWNNIRFYWVDERCVSPKDAESNFGVVNQLLFSNIEINNSQIERIKGEANPSEEVCRYDKILSSQLPVIKSIPVFDLILLGMGDDGHTASIFPNQLHLLHSLNNCELAEHPLSAQKRITLTARIINNAHEAIFLVTGKNKSKILKEIIQKEGNYFQYPSAHIQLTHGILTWMVDKEAAELL
jgi:6-phosphogluconolactonase